MSARFFRDPEVVIVAAKRTVFGKIQSMHKNQSALNLAESAAQATIEEAGIDKETIDHCIVGSVLTSGPNHAYLPRHLSLSLGLSESCPSYLVNRLCGSGMQALIDAYLLIKAAKAKCVLSTGVESMSQALHYVEKKREGKKLGHATLIDSVAAILHDQWINMPMGKTADNLALQYGFSKQRCDEYTLESHEKYNKAWSSGFYEYEMLKSERSYTPDEFFKLSNPEKLNSLSPVFSKQGVHSAASSSGLADGASAIIVMDRYEADLRGIQYHCIMKDYAVTGCDPKFMGLGPVSAIRQLLNQQSLSMRDISLFDINEAFAGQVLAVKHELGIPKQRLNINGGSLAMGHPLGASANRNVVTLSSALKRENKSYGIASACIGGGQGIATLLQNIA